MQQQQTKINQMKKQHELRFSQKRAIQLGASQANSQMSHTRTKSFYDSASKAQGNQFQTMGQSINLAGHPGGKNKYHQ